VPVVTAGTALVALGSLLTLILGVIRKTLAMAHDGHLLPALAAVQPQVAVPHRAELAVGVVSAHEIPQV
jgi:APA family basic amino acid/polyamine antiporter